ncbi:hypothetical protein [Rossellomorea marisflavi]|uniref:hypothetical protein n=1 Tax=Rossellomorea marisflavi TaxID=189381 RepID=UPI003D2F0658
MLILKIDGLKEFQKQLKDIEKAAEELDGEHEVPLHELFTDSFLRKNTKFSSYEDFDSQEIFEKYSTFEDIPDKELDEFVSTNTNFSGWGDMLDTAATEYASRKLGF